MTDVHRCAEDYIRVHSLHVAAVMGDVVHPRHPAVTLTGATSHGKLIDVTIVGSYDDLLALGALITRRVTEERELERRTDAAKH